MILRYKSFISMVYFFLSVGTISVIIKSWFCLKVLFIEPDSSMYIFKIVTSIYRSNNIIIKQSVYYYDSLLKLATIE